MSYRRHDVFEPWQSEIDVIKVANVLRRSIFTDGEIAKALLALHGSLKPGGHLLIVDNPRIPGIACRAGVYRRCGSEFQLVAETPEASEVADLVSQVRGTSA